ncbi:MAG: hypothetical protein RL516_487 [Bacteroidota bacterium]|jgi:hypothetical protein
MIIYNVTVNVDHDVAEDWLSWMIDAHIPDVLNTGMFHDYSILRLVGDEKSGGITYAIQYRALNMAMYERYKDEFAPALQADAMQRFAGKFVAFRTLLEVVK